jgi:low temperature requirement protein LtrA
MTDDDASGGDQSLDSGDERSQGNLELFFDLVFTFAMAQVTQLVLHNMSWSGMGQAALALLAVWWAWVGYTWLTNTFETARVGHQSLIMAAMAAMLVAAVALPTAFTSGALVFGVALSVVRLIHVGKFLAYSRREDDADLESAARRIAPAFVVAPALIVLAAFVDHPYRELCWVGAALIDYGAPAVLGMGGFRVSASYFVERHGSIVIIALGEAILELGGGAKDLHRLGVIAALVLGVAVSATLWWTYFGLTGGAKQRLAQANGVERAVLARDAYSYLHLPLIAGIMFFAVGEHVAVAHVDAPLELLPALAMTGGVALFYVGEVAYRWRDHHQFTADRALTAMACAAVFPAALQLPALATMSILAGIGFARVGWELWRRPQIGPVTAGAPR